MDPGTQPVALGDLRLASPVIAAAGALGFLSDAVRPLALESLGAAITAGIGWRSRRGSAPAIEETAGGALYRPGDAMVGVQEVLRRHARAWPSAGTAVIVNLRALAWEEFGLIAAELEGTAGLSALELDFTSLDPQSGAPLAWEPRAAAVAVRDVRLATAVPVLVKLPGETPQLATLLRACAAAGAQAATIGCGLPAGGARLVGPATFAVALEALRAVASQAPLPLIGAGGVTAAAQVRAYLRAGAAAVQVGSVHLADPLAAVDIQRTLSSER